MVHCVTQQQPEKFTAPRWSISPRPNEQAEVTFTGKIGIAYRLQAATNLASANWADVSSFTPSQPKSWFIFSTTSFSRRFFRVVTP
jgi:hypothetical protein